VSPKKNGRETAPDQSREPEAPAEAPAGLTLAEPPVSRESYEALQRENADLKDQVLRRRADFENYKKRVERDQRVASHEAVAQVFQDLVPIVDNLDRALHAAAHDDAMREGVDLIRRQIIGVLEAHGVRAEDPTGKPFDPETHQALSHESVAGFADGTVVEVFQKAYFLGSRLLRPALVKVAKGEEAAPDSEKETVH
jgi:molecular chaperone GrpE